MNSFGEFPESVFTIPKWVFILPEQLFTFDQNPS
jgi:hypothetical protein